MMSRLKAKVIIRSYSMRQRRIAAAVKLPNGSSNDRRAHSPHLGRFFGILLPGEGQRFHEVKLNTTDYYLTNNRSLSFI